MRLVVSGGRELSMSGMYQGECRAARTVHYVRAEAWLPVLRCSRTWGGVQPYLAAAVASILSPAAGPDPPAMEGAVQAPSFDSILRSRHDPVAFTQGHHKRIWP